MRDLERQPAEAAALSLVLVVLDQVNAYQTQLLDGVRSVLDGHQPVVVYVNDPFAHAIRSPARRLLESGLVGGVITTMLSDSASQDDLTKTLDECDQLPVVQVGAPLAGGSSVGTDNVAGIAAVMAHLLDELGAQRIAVVTGPSHHPDSRAREAAVRQELAARGRTLTAGAVLDGDFDRDTAYAAMSEFLAAGSRVDAVVALNDRCAAGVLDALNDEDLRVPADVLVTGFDDDSIALECDPTLTTVDQKLFEQGATAARCLLDRMNGEQAHGHVVTTPSLIVRGSTKVGWQRPIVQSSVGQRVAHTQSTAGLMNRARSMSRAFMGCQTVDDLLRVFSASIPRLDLRRCFVVFYAEGVDRAHPQGTLALRHRQRQTELSAAAPPFALSDVLPPELLDELTTGFLMLQPLTVGSDELGYVLFEQEGPDRFVGEILRMDLGRALDTVQRIMRHTDLLEALVSQRTQELRAQIEIRVRAEDNLRRANAELDRLSKSDGLTLIANRAAFDTYLGEQWDAHTATGEPLSLLFMDVDHFKQVNDTYGHVLGDECLRAVARCLQEATWSPGDLAARFGGDEFAAVLPSTDVLGATAVAARVQKAIGSVTVLGPAGVRAAFTVSIGVATARPSRLTTSTQLLAQADAALYEAKNGGRARVVTARSA